MIKSKLSLATFQGLPLGSFAVLWLVGWTLRVPILSGPPLATHMADTFGLGDVGIGAITMLPVVAVAFGAIPAAWLIARFEFRTTIAVGILVMAMASVARGFLPTAFLLFAVSVVMGLGVAVFQTALPAAVRSWTPSHAALGSAVYLNGMMVGEFTGAGLTLPVMMPLADGDWKIALVIWAIPIVLIAVLAKLFRPAACNLPRDDVAEPQTPNKSAFPRWNDLQMWQFGLLLACSIAIFFVGNAYMGTILRERDESHALAGLLFAYNLSPLLASFAVLAAPQWIGRRNPLGVAAIIATLGLAGFMLLDGWFSWIAAVVAGLASTVELILLVSIPAAIARGLGVTRLSAGTTLIGYAIGFLLPLAGGWIAENTGDISMVLLPTVVFSIAMIPALGRTREYVCKSLLAAQNAKMADS